MTDAGTRPAVTAAPASAGPTRRSGGTGFVLLACGAGGALLVALAAWAHLWFAPFVVGLVAGALTGARRIRGRSAFPVAAAAGLSGWALPLLWRALSGEPVAATARVVALLAGLPPAAGTVIAAALLVATVQSLLGAWLGRAVTGLRHRPARS